MYGTVPLTTRSIDDYSELLGPDIIEELRELAEPLQGARVLNLNISAFGTGVADLLSAAVPLLTDLGIDCHWQVVRAGEEFGHVTKALYSALCGDGATWTADLSDIWMRYCEMNARLLDEPFDFVIVHDPQPAGIRACHKANARIGQWIWHCHMDLSHAVPGAWADTAGGLRDYDAVVFPTADFLPPGPVPGRLRIVPPCIDPLGPRNMDISDATITSLLERHAIDIERPIVAQIAPMSDAYDPLGAIDVHMKVRERVPSAQLVLVAAPFAADAAARAYFERVSERAAGAPDVHVLAGLDDVGSVEINVLQRASTVVLQRRLTRGYGIWLSEAQWKRRPIVGAPDPGVRAQVIDGVTGYLAATVAEQASRVVELIHDSALRTRMGRAAHESTLRHSLLTRYLRDTLTLLNDLRESAVPAGGAPPLAGRPT